MEIKMVSTSSTHPGKMAAGPYRTGTAPHGNTQSDIGTHHEDVPVGEVEQHEDAVHHGITESDQGVKAAPLQGIDQVLHEKLKVMKAAPVKRKGKQASPVPSPLGPAALHDGRRPD
jgi:hypothetical protein